MTAKIGQDWMSLMDNIGEKILGPVSIHGGMQLKQKKETREQFKKDDENGLLTQAHASAASALINFLSRISGKPIPEGRDDVQGQLTLIAHFVQGIDLCETAIVEGLYVQAATLLRQQHEIIAAIEEYKVGKRAEKKTPHATIGVLADMGKVYGELSGTAHVSHSEILKEMVIMEVGEKHGPSLLPIYHRDLARNLYVLHVSYIMLIADLVSDLHRGLTGDELNKDEASLVYVAREILIQTGLIKFREAS